MLLIVLCTISEGIYVNIVDAQSVPFFHLLVTCYLLKLNLKGKVK